MKCICFRVRVIGDADLDSYVVFLHLINFMIMYNAYDLSMGTHDYS